MDSGQTIATITQDQSGAAVATLANQSEVEGPIEMALDEVIFFNVYYLFYTQDFNRNPNSFMVNSLITKPKIYKRTFGNCAFHF